MSPEPKKPAAKKPAAAKPAAKKAPRKAARRGTADVAKLRKAVIVGIKSGKSAEVVAEQLGISRPYLYRLKSGG